MTLVAKGGKSIYMMYAVRKRERANTRVQYRELDTVRTGCVGVAKGGSDCGSKRNVRLRKRDDKELLGLRVVRCWHYPVKL